MAIQSTYDERLNIGFAGQISSSIPSTLITGRAEEAIPFGRACVQGTADRDFMLLSAVGQRVLGISRRDQSIDPDSVNEYPVNENVALLEQGEIFVTAGANVAAGQTVFARLDGTFANSGLSLIHI